MFKRLVSLVVVVAVVYGTVPVRAHAEAVSEMQWYLAPLRIPEMQAITRGDGVVVAVIDDGVAAAHPDLTGQVLPGRGFGTAAGTDGQTDRNRDGHGTCMAGIIAGRGGSSDRTLGIAPGAKILPVAVGVSDSPPAAIADGIRWAVDNGADVINMSFGRFSEDELERSLLTAAVRYAIEHDVVVVSGSGNVVDANGDHHPDDNVFMPGDISGVVTVASTDKSASHDPLAIHGPEVVLSAPGIDIVCPTLMTSAGPGYGHSNQTSPATAIVSGVAALIRSKYPDMSAANVVNRLIKTAKDQGDPGRDAYFGFGTIRPYDALTANITSVSKYPLPLPELPKAAATTKPKTKIDPATAGWGVGISALLVFLLVRLMVRKLRRPKISQPPTMPMATSKPLAVQPTVIVPQLGAVPPPTQPQPPVVYPQPPDNHQPPNGTL